MPPMQPDGCAIFLVRTTSFLDDVMKAAGVKVPIDGMVSHGKTGDWHEQQQ